jgi:serine/threonine protein kinase
MRNRVELKGALFVGAAGDRPAEAAPATAPAQCAAQCPERKGETPRASSPEVAFRAPVPGLTLSGKYRLVREIASGNMGAVWRAEHLGLGCPVAVKLMLAGSAGDNDARERFLREARVTSALRSRHIVQVLDYGTDRSTPYIVLELLEGESLAQRLTRVGRLGVLETAGVLRQVASGLSRAHAHGIVHRDLKPENIVIVREHGDALENREGREQRDGRQRPEDLVKLIDFGVAKHPTNGAFSRVSHPTGPLTVVGTPHYMSPEQARAPETIDERTDVWALGVIAYECLLGYPPFVASSLAALIEAICRNPLPVPSRAGLKLPGFDRWFARACHRDRTRRFASATEAAQRLHALCTNSARGRFCRPPRAGARAGEGVGEEAVSLAGWALRSRRAGSSAQPRRVGPLALVGAVLCGVLWIGAARGTRVAVPDPPRVAASERQTHTASEATSPPGPLQAAPPDGLGRHFAPAQPNTMH